MPAPQARKFIYNSGLARGMASREITVGVGIPMIVVGALMAFLWAPFEAADSYRPQIELVGSTIGILGIAFFIAGLFYTKEPVMH